MAQMNERGRKQSEGIRAVPMHCNDAITQIYGEENRFQQGGEQV